MISSLIRAFNAFVIAFVKRVSPLSGYDISSIAYGNGKFIGLAFNGSIHKTVVSTDGITWTAGTTLTVFHNESSASKIMFGNGIFVAYQNGDYTSKATTVVSSTDGITWTKRSTIFTNAANDYVSDMIFARGLFILYGYTGSPFVPRIVTSADGITWTSRTTGLTTEDQIMSMGNSDSLIVAGALINSSKSITLLKSTNGTTWTKVTFPYQTDGYIYSSYFINNTFVIITSKNKVFISPDGTNWTKRDTDAQNPFIRLLANNLAYMNIYENTIRTIYVSTNGVDWNILPTSFTTQSITSIIYANGLYVASSGKEIGTSTSGIG